MGLYSSHLELLKGEAASEPDLHVVLDGLGVHHGAEGTVHGAGEDLGGLLGTGCSRRDGRNGEQAEEIQQERAHPT